MNLKETLLAIVRQTLEEAPPQTLFRPEDEAAILKVKDVALQAKEEMVKGFYDTLFSHPKTAQVFREGERPAREKTLEGWIERTFSGPIDEEYWLLEAATGVMHLSRGVTFAQGGVMFSWIGEQVARRASSSFSPEDVLAFSLAWSKLTALILGVTQAAAGFAMMQAIGQGSGLEPALVQRLAAQGMSELVEGWRASLR
ncbi:protoglobin domain-containing protein [Thermus filiformis]|uniref:protoglobin domain-containing protein n=1 Tax=Thermus filiformis TaxID=276 RepID=UPI000531AB68|nr:protoglobin domain-containing protein [Thermus filiformis]